MDNKIPNRFIVTLWFLLPIVIFAQGAYQPNNCATSIKICAESYRQTVHFNLSVPEEVNDHSVLTYYTHMICTESGTIQLSAGLNGSYVLYGPFSLTSTNLDRCEAISLGMVNVLSSGTLSSTSGLVNIPHGVGVFMLRVNLAARSQYPTNAINPWFKVGVKTSTCKEEPMDECEDCLKTFSPQPGRYILSAWVKGEIINKNTSYLNPFIAVGFNDGPKISYLASGQIIDDWQKVDAIIVVPDGANTMQIELGCNSGDCFFDDFRFYPIDGSMVTYTYDAITMRLVAQLDERNYATLYEYDEEGKLIRVKKETERGIMTIQENTNNISK